MNFSMFKNLQGTVSGVIKNILTPKAALPFRCSQGIHQICNQYSSPSVASSHQSTFKPMNFLASVLRPTSFLVPTIPQFNQVCGMKRKGRLQLRCRGCYYVSRQGKLYVMCSLKPRHKQVQMQKTFRKRQILTFAHQKKQRDWD